MNNPKEYLSPELPNDLEAERIVLGAIVIGHQESKSILESLTINDFFDSKHRTIFQEILQINEAGLALDTMMLLSELASHGTLEKAGGQGYVTSVDNGIHAKIQIEFYIQKVEDTKLIRDLIYLTENIRSAAFSFRAEGVRPQELFDLGLESISKLSSQAHARNIGVTLIDAAGQLLTQLRDGKAHSIFSGLPSLDDYTGGFRAGEIIQIMAGTGVGKTFLALQMARRACEQGQHILYCSGEMLAAHLMGRVLCSHSEVSYWKIRRPEKMNEIEYFALFEAAQTQCNICRILDGELSMRRIRIAARAMAAKRQLGLIVVDYDELVEAPGKTIFDQQRYVIRSCKSLAMELAIPVIMVSQLRKNLTDQERAFPTLAMMYGDSSKAKDASFAIFLDRPYVQDLKTDETAATIFLLKSRDGSMGRIDCEFNVQRFSFTEKGKL